MPLHAEWVRHDEGRGIGYLCHPERVKGPLPAVVVLQEAWGVNEHIEDVTRRFASAGYAAFAPDLFAHGGERPPALAKERIAELLAFLNTQPPTVLMDSKARTEALSKLPADHAKRIDEVRATIMGDEGRPGLTRRDYLPQLLAATRFLRDECTITRGQRIASVGFCMGGGLSALLACNDPQLAAAVVFYGSAPPEDLIPKINCPVLAFYGGLDQRINAGIPAFAQAMERLGKRYEKHIYENVLHSFFNDSRPTYDVRAARDAFARTLALFRTVLV